MTYAEALAFVKKHGRWETGAFIPQERFVTIHFSCTHQGDVLNRDYTIWAGVFDYRPELFNSIIESEQLLVARAIMRREENLNAEV